MIVEVKHAAYPLWKNWLLAGIRQKSLELGWVRAFALARIDAEYFPHCLKRVRP